MTDQRATASVIPYGDGALLIEVGDVTAAHRLDAALGAERAKGRTPAALGESVVGYGNLVIHVDGGGDAADEVASWLRRRVRELTSPGPGGAMGTVVDAHGERIVIPATFDGPDLAEVASGLGTSVDRVVAMLCSVDLEVAFLGFSPGFPYLIGLPSALARIRRRPTPRPSVPAGSVAVAGGFATVYPTATPGGWLLLGRTSLSLFDPERPPYARLRPGDTVRFAPVYESLPAAPPPRRALMMATGPRFAEVIESGLLSLIQDRGRRSSAGVGVPRAGPADPEAMRLANRLVGNSDDAAVIEVTASGPTLRFTIPTHLAVVAATGDPEGVELHLDGRAVGSGAVVPVGAGQSVAVGRVRTGLRAYLAVGGGFDVTPQLGSRSSDVLSGLGPPPLAAGDRLGLGAPTRPHGVLLHPPAPPLPGRHRAVRVLPGPHRLAGEGYRRLLATTWVVGDDSNRIGLRLVPAPDRPGGSGSVADDGEHRSAPAGAEVGAPPTISDLIPSTGMVTGAVQVPPDGRPIILLPDHATVGGYPVGCCVISADLSVLGQLAPGDTLSLVPVDPVAAAAAHRRFERSLDERVSGWFPTVAGT